MKYSPDITKGEMVKRYVRHLLRDDIISYGSKIPSEHELMDKFQVSRQTVRQAFGALEAEGLIYKEQGKGTFSNYDKGAGQNRIVAVVTTYLSGFVFPGIMSGIEQVLSDEGYMMLLSNTNNIKEREARYLRSVLEHNVVGIIIEPTASSQANSNLKLLRGIEEKGIKTVFINALYDDFESAYVLLNDLKGGLMATDYLLQMRHRRIAGIFKTDDKQGIDRKAGFLKALSAAGIPEASEFIGEYNTAQMYDYPYMFAQSLLQKEGSPTAFFCYNDQCALMVIRAIHDRGLRVPEDISVVGYDDSAFPMHSEAKLTTIRHPKKEMGIQAAKFMVGMLEGRMRMPQYMYEPELIIRKSCRNL